MNSTVLSILLHVFQHTYVCLYYCVYLRMEQLGQRRCVCPALVNDTPISRTFALIVIPISNVGEFQFTHYPTRTGIPHFLKVQVMPLHFYKRPTLVPVFVNQKKSQDDFSLLRKKGKKRKWHCVCFAAKHPKQQKWPPSSSFPRNYTEHLSIMPSEL